MWRFHRLRRKIALGYIRHGIYPWLTPWLNMLEVYHSLGRQAEFETVALYIHDDFNCQLIRWHANDEQFGNPPRLSLEAFPHIVERITATWGRKECLIYLRTLLEDKRDKTRNGFHLAVFQEILLLAGVLEIQLSSDSEEGESSPENQQPGPHSSNTPGPHQTQ
jgi:hypothetical protein